MRNLKRALSLALASVMLMGMMVVGTGAKDFVDAGDIKNKEAAAVTAALGIIQGDAGKFMPDRIVSRAEMAVLLCRIMQVPQGLIDSLASEKTFTDVGTDNWSTGAIAMAAKKKWIEGDGAIKADGMANFYPEYTITTAEAVLMLQRALGYWHEKDTSGSGNDLSDAIVLSFELNMMENLSLTAGAGLTRDNLSAIIYNTLLNTVPVTYDTSKGYLLAHDTDKKATAANIKNALGDDYSNSLFDSFGASKSSSTYTDALGRPLTAWMLDGEVIACSPEVADFTYDNETDAEDIADDMRVDYTDDEDFFDYLERALNKANTVVEIFGDDENADVVIYTYQASVVEDVDTDKNGVTTVTLEDNNEYITSSYVDFDEGDVVVYTELKNAGKDPITGDKYEGDIATIELAKLIAGEITSKSSSYIRVDGDKYYVDNVSSLAVGAEGVLVIDPNGNEITFIAESAPAAQTYYAYVSAIRIATSAETGKEVGYADITTDKGVDKTVSLDMSNDNDDLHKAGEPEAVYSYRYDDGKYILVEKFNDSENNIDIESGKRSFVDGCSVDFETIFVDIERGEVYVGIEDVVDYDNADVSYVEDDGVAVVVFITDAKLVGEANDTMVFIANTDYESSIDSSDNIVYVYADALVDGDEDEVIATSKNLFDKVGLYTIDKVNSKGYATAVSDVDYDDEDVVVDSYGTKTIFGVKSDESYTFDAKTVFIVVDGDKVSAGSEKDLIIDADADKGDDTCTISVVLESGSNYAEVVVITIEKK